jgi:hypothetical protein
MSRNRHNHLVLVDISFPVAVPPGLAAELVEAALREAVDRGELMITHGNGPNPPYEANPEINHVYEDERP